MHISNCSLLLRLHSFHAYSFWLRTVKKKHTFAWPFVLLQCNMMSAVYECTYTRTYITYTHWYLLLEPMTLLSVASQIVDTRLILCSKLFIANTLSRYFSRPKVITSDGITYLNTSTVTKGTCCKQTPNNTPLNCPPAQTSRLAQAEDVSGYLIIKIIKEKRLNRRFSSILINCEINHT